MFGMKVVLKVMYGFHISNVVYRNVTEVHHNYNIKEKMYDDPATAFESDLHVTGITVPTHRIKEMQITVETELAPSFDA